MWFNHPEETWIPAKVNEGGTGMITVEMDDGLVRDDVPAAVAR